MNKWILVLLLISAGCGKHKTKPVTAISQVLYKEVESKTVPFVISSIGHFKASDEAQIKAQVEGYLQSYGAAEGNLVKKNDLFFLKRLENACIRLRAKFSPKRESQQWNDLIKHVASLAQVRYQLP